MKLFILNDRLERVRPVSIYKSITWNTFYNKEGDFTIELPLRYFPDVVPYDNKDAFFENTSEQTIGVIEAVEKKKGSDGQLSLIVKGRTAESLLDRRIQLQYKAYEDKRFDFIMGDFFDTNITQPTNVSRSIPILTFKANNFNDTINYKMSRGKDGLVIAKELCDILGCGFVIGLDPTASKLQFNFYEGTDRSIDQNRVNPVIIQTQRRTAVSVDYYKDILKDKTYAEIDKENEKQTTYTKKYASGLRRKETFLDLSSISQTITLSDGTQVVIKDKYYANMIRNEAVSRMSKMATTEYLDSNIAPEVAQQFNKKFFLGDTITVKDDDTGFIDNKQITGATEVWGDTGYDISLQLGENAV